MTREEQAKAQTGSRVGHFHQGERSDNQRRRRTCLA